MGPLGKALGMGAKKSMPMMDDEEEDDGADTDRALDASPEPMPEEEPSSVPPEFQSAYDEWESAPSVDTMYSLIEACKSGGGGEKPGGLALILGGKGKK